MNAYLSLNGRGRGGRLFEVGANSRLGAYSNKYGMRVTTSQYEISGKNHICSVKTFSTRAESTRLRKKNSLEQAAF